MVALGGVCGPRGAPVIPGAPEVRLNVLRDREGLRHNNWSSHNNNRQLQFLKATPVMVSILPFFLMENAHMMC